MGIYGILETELELAECKATCCAISWVPKGLNFALTAVKPNPSHSKDQLQSLSLLWELVRNTESQALYDFRKQNLKGNLGDLYDLVLACDFQIGGRHW